MRFYTVRDDYIEHLKSFDEKVPDNYRGKRPFIGVVLEIDSIKYLAPLTSYKPKQDKLDPSLPSVLKIHERTDPSNKLGMVQLNNMIPVVDEVIALLDLESQPEPYKSMLYKQYEFLKLHHGKLLQKAGKIHQHVSNGHTFFSRISCDFKKLEAASISFIQVNK